MVIFTLSIKKIAYLIGLLKKEVDQIEAKKRSKQEATKPLLLMRAWIQFSKKQTHQLLKRGNNLSKKTRKKMKKAEKNTIYYYDVCGCEIVCRTPSTGPLTCCNTIMCCY